MVSINEIKLLRDKGHTIDSLIQMLERKEKYRAENKHWFVFENGRNVCEFCKCLYHFGLTEYGCNAEQDHENKEYEAEQLWAAQPSEYDPS